MQEDFLQQKETNRTLEYTIGDNGRLVLKCESSPPVAREKPRSDKKRARRGGEDEGGSHSVLPLLWQEFMRQQGSWGGSGGGWGGATERVPGEVGKCGGGRGDGGSNREEGLPQGRRSKHGHGGVQHKLEAWERQRQREDGGLHRASIWDWEFHKGEAVYVVEVETLGQKDVRKAFRRQAIGIDWCLHRQVVNEEEEGSREKRKGTGGVSSPAQRNASTTSRKFVHSPMADCTTDFNPHILYAVGDSSITLTGN